MKKRAKKNPHPVVKKDTLGDVIAVTDETVEQKPKRKVCSIVVGTTNITQPGGHVHVHKIVMTNTEIEEAAERLGVSPTFYRQMKKYDCRTPEEYRKYRRMYLKYKIKF